MEVDGGNSLHKLIYITIPMVSPVLFYNAVMCAITSFQAFLIKPASFFTYLILILLASTFILPLIWMLRSSLMGMKQIFRLPPEWIPAWFALSMSSMMLPGAVTLIPVFLGYRNAGMYDTLFPLFLAAWFGGGASNQFLLRQFLMGIPKALDEAAYIDGAGYFRIFISIVLPLCKSALVVVGMFSFLFYWNDFFLSPLIYLENYKNSTPSRWVCSPLSASIPANGCCSWPPRQSAFFRQSSCF